MVQEKTYKWVQDRLRELHAGTISTEDLRQLNALAQADPFIADAIEGFELHPDHPHQASLARLESKIRPYKLERRRWLIPNLTVTAVAASLILIIGFWAVMYRLNKDEELAVVETSHEVILLDATVSTSPAEPTITSEPTPSSSASKESLEEMRTEASPEKPVTGSRSASNQSTDDVAIMNPKETAVTSAAEPVAREGSSTKTVAPSSTSGDTKPEGQVTVQDESQRAAKDPMYFANQMDPAIYAKRAAGRVVSASGEPLIGASLTIRNTNLGTVSDLNGQFELFLPAPESTVDITFSGYEGAAVNLRQGEDDVAILLPEINFDKTTLAMQRQAETMQAKQDASGAAVATHTENQQQAYIDYLRKNSRYPLKDNLYTPGQTVTLQFAITATGEPSQIRIVESSNDRKFDDEAVRLIRKGPKWKCEGENYPCEMRYTLFFQ